MRAELLLALALAGCGAPPLEKKPPPDLSTVTESFAPSKVPLHQALGVAVPSLPADATMRGALLDELQQLGVGMIRRDFTWATIEPSLGQFDFSADDAAVDDANARGIATLGILDYNAPWAAPGDDVDTPPDPDQFASFAQQVAMHFKGRVVAWEIWNEENIGFRFWKPVEDAGAYGDLLAKTYPAVKAADPAATVLFGGLNSQGASSTGEDFLADAYFAHPDLGRFYDVLAVHPYMDYPPSRAPELTVGNDYAEPLKLSRYRAMLDYYGDSTKPIWVTEVGWPVQPPVDENVQANFIVRGVIEAVATGADRVFVYTLSDGPSPTTSTEDAFGLLRHDGTDKPSYLALQQLLTRDPSATVVEDRSSGEMRSYVFAGASGRFGMWWTSDATSTPTYVDNP